MKTTPKKIGIAYHQLTEHKLNYLVPTQLETYVMSYQRIFCKVN